MKLERGKYRAVAKANRLSLEIIMISVADTVHVGAGSILTTDYRRGCKRPAGSEMMARYYKELI